VHGTRCRLTPKNDARPFAFRPGGPLRDLDDVRHLGFRSLPIRAGELGQFVQLGLLRLGAPLDPAERLSALLFVTDVPLAEAPSPFDDRDKRSAQVFGQRAREIGKLFAGSAPLGIDFLVDIEAPQDPAQRQWPVIRATQDSDMGEGHEYGLPSRAHTKDRSHRVARGALVERLQTTEK
jgi:hypothetical protein